MPTTDPVDQATAQLAQAEANVAQCAADLAAATSDLEAVKAAATPQLLADPKKTADVAEARVMAVSVVETRRDMLAAAEATRDAAATDLNHAQADRIDARDLPVARAALEAWEAKEAEILEQLIAHGGTHPADGPNATRTVEHLRKLWRAACQRNVGQDIPLGQPANLYDLLNDVKKLEAKRDRLRPVVVPEPVKMTNGQEVLTFAAKDVRSMKSLGWHVASAEELDRAAKGVRITDPMVRDLAAVVLPEEARRSPGWGDDVTIIGLPAIGVAGE